MPFKRLHSLLLSLAMLTCSSGFAATGHASHAGVCPAAGKVLYSTLSVGPYGDLVILAPEPDSRNYPNLDFYYRQGETLTVRCEYTDGSVRDIELRQPVKTCRPRWSKRHGRQLICE